MKRHRRNKLNNLKNSVFLILLLGIAEMTEAQMLDGSVADTHKTWPMPGATWTYCLYTELGDVYAKEVWQVTSDSLIGDCVYDVIQPVDTLGLPIANSGKMLLTRYANDTVYRFVNNKEYLFFVFNLNEGDVFTTFRSAGWGSYGVPNYGNDSTCCSLKPLLVTQKNEVELGGLTLNEYSLKDTLFTSLYDYDEYLGYWKIVDRIGPINTYPLIDIHETGSYNGLCTYWFVCAPQALLSAYRDDSFEQVWFVCNPTSVAENSMEEVIKVYPNPSMGIVHIESVDVSEVQVYNRFGLLVKTFQKTNQINLETLPKGIYMLIIKNKYMNIKYATKIIIY